MLPSSCLTAFNNAMFNATNVHRVKHRVAPLIFNNTLTATAEKWACGIVDNFTMSHNANRGVKVGENLYVSMNSATFNMTEANCASKILILIFLIR